MLPDPRHATNHRPPDCRHARSSARLVAVQALYQQAQTGATRERLLREFHQHRLDADPDWAEDGQLHEIDRAFFDALVSGSLARQHELDALIGRFLGNGWSVGRLDPLLLQILRLGAYELLAHADVPRAAVVSEYVDVAGAFYGARESGFVNALLDRLGKHVRPG